MYFDLFIVLLKIVLIVVSILLTVAFMTVAERKYLSSIQRRKGPNIVGFYGLLQAVADGLKLVLKETTKPTSADSLIYVFSPILVFSLSLSCFGVLPFSEGLVLSDIRLGIMYILALSSLSVYGLLLAGYSSNSKYGFFGGIRSAAQMISYEVSIGFIISTVFLFNGGSLNLSNIVLMQSLVWNIFSLFPMFVIFVVSILAETNRHPFDLPEAESELVSGYNVEYSAGSFALFFLGEYSSIVLMSSLTVLLFLGGWLGFSGLFSSILIFSIKVFMVICIFIWARSAYPRYRYDQLIKLSWLSLLSFSLGFVLWISSFSYCF